MFKMYGDYKFKLEKDFYENDKNGNYFVVTKVTNSDLYQIILYNKKGVALLEKDITSDESKFDKELESIISEFESLI
jgi:hypothetical protein